MVVLLCGGFWVRLQEVGFLWKCCVWVWIESGLPPSECCESAPYEGCRRWVLFVMKATRVGGRRRCGLCLEGSDLAGIGSGL